MCCKSILLMFPGLSGAFLGLYEGTVRVLGGVALGTSTGESKQCSVCTTRLVWLYEVRY